MLDRLPMTLVQLKAENNAKNLKNKTFTIFFVSIKKINQKKTIKLWSILFEKGNNQNTGKSKTNESHKVRLT